MNVRKMFVWITGLSLLVASVFANACDCRQPLDRIVLQLQSESWAKTTTANVSINIDAILDKVTVGKIRSEIMQKLIKVEGGDWQISSFSQAQNVSGLEEVHAVAELRMPEASLASLQSNVKEITRPGLNFKVANIDFAPSFEDIEATRDNLREKIYSLVTAEIKRLEKAYPGQKYVIHTINFVPELMPIEPVGDSNFMGRGLKMMGAAPMAAMNVGTKVHMNALVELMLVSPTKS